MKRFAQLFQRLDETNKTNRKIAALVEYFRAAPPIDAAWALYFLTGNRPKRLLKSRSLVEWCAEEAGVSLWMFDECYEVVGDLAETMALLLPQSTSGSDKPLSYWVTDRLLELRDREPQEQRAQLLASWRELSSRERFVWNKLITGEFRVGVSRQLVVRALAEFSGVPADVISHRLMGTWEPTADFFASLLHPETSDAHLSRPYPFCLAHAFQGELAELGDPSEWLIEWKWDGIRAQVVRRGEGYTIWSRGEDLIGDRFPDLAADAQGLPPGTVVDGEIVAWRNGRVLPFAEMQRRIGRKQLGRKILGDVPARFIAFDLLEYEGRDLRSVPMVDRRRMLEQLLSERGEQSRFSLSPTFRFDTWDEVAAARQRSREEGVEGFMFKRLDSPYSVGRTTGLWWKWKIDPHTVDAVMVYAQRGHGRRAALYTDYTFAVWQDGELVPFAKAYSGLTDEEIRAADRFVRQNTLERFGPVRRVKPELVFELAFERIQRSPRHKSGVAVRFPRIARWRTDKRPDQADTMETLLTLLDRTSGVDEEPEPIDESADVLPERPRQYTLQFDEPT
jgi:DNA ligase-1